ncbi:MAG: LPS export ABC transporter periplasmic protein LptC [Chitinophagaceae bacterium]|nr:LPS export ABC transporter periplasmic protein LptC [Chitinophagaceae bacterium]
MISCFFLWACENDVTQVQNWNQKVEMVETGKQILAYLSTEGKVRAKLTAPLLLRYQTDTLYSEFPNSLHVDFYDDSTKVESQLDALYGIYYESFNKVYLRDSVMVFNTNGDTLRTSELWWDQQTQKFYNDKPTRIDTKTQHLYGAHGIEASQDFSQIILNQPSGTIEVEE